VSLTCFSITSTYVNPAILNSKTSIFEDAEDQISVFLTGDLVDYIRERLGPFKNILKAIFEKVRIKSDFFFFFFFFFFRFF
jgi:hypothetical protein